MNYDEWLDTLDDLVAEHVMGWVYNGGAGAWYENTDRATIWRGDDFTPTTDWCDAGRVLEKLWRREWMISFWLSWTGQWCAGLEDEMSVLADTPQLAIVLVAFKATGIEIPEEPKHE